jgi:hypothetical protein
LDVFKFRENIITDYARFSRSFTGIRASDIKEFVDREYAAQKFWPAPLVQLNPNFVPGGTIDELCDTGLLHQECRKIFRAGKAPHGIGTTIAAQCVHAIWTASAPGAWRFAPSAPASVELILIEAGQRQIEAGGLQIAEFKPQQFLVPVTRIRQSIVCDRISLALRLAPAAGDDGRNLGNAFELGGLKPAVAYDQHPVLTDQHRHGPTEFIAQSALYLGALFGVVRSFFF